MANVEATDIPADSGAPGPADVLKRIQAENIRNVRLVADRPVRRAARQGRDRAADGARADRGAPVRNPAVRVEPLAAARARRARLQPRHRLPQRRSCAPIPLTFAPLPWTPGTAHLLTDLLRRRPASSSGHSAGRAAPGARRRARRSASSRCSATSSSSTSSGPDPDRAGLRARLRPAVLVLRARAGHGPEVHRRTGPRGRGSWACRSTRSSASTAPASSRSTWSPGPACWPSTGSWR